MPPPADEAELYGRATRLAGWTLGALAAREGWPVPPSLLKAKGWVGRLVEQALGVEGGAKRAPDLAHAGVEVKTIPVDDGGRPRESTFVCTIRLGEMSRADFEGSLLLAKLSRVLWVPVQAEPARALADRRVGNPLLWSPTPAERAQLRADWEEVAELVARGGAAVLSAHRGALLQVRPKAAHARVRTAAPDGEGGVEAVLPRGFYLRRRFTQRILAAHYAV